MASKPEWSQLRDKLSFVKYGGITHRETQAQRYVVYAYSPLALRKAAWMKLFPDAECVQKVTEFEEDKMYCVLKLNGGLKTLGEPLRKDLMQEKHETNADTQQTKQNAEYSGAEYSGKNVTGKKRKACNDSADFIVENKERTEKISKLKEEISKHKSYMGILQWQTENILRGAGDAGRIRRVFFRMFAAGRIVLRLFV